MFPFRTVPFRTIVVNIYQKNYVHTTRVCNTFWERDEKGGYGKKTKTLPNIQMIRDGFKELKKEVALWKEEVKEHFESDPIVLFRPGETDVKWKFGDPESLNQWVATSDSDHNEGYSSCSLTLNKYGKGLFSGTLSTVVPKDGRVRRSGYCNIKTMRARVLFLLSSLLNFFN